MRFGACFARVNGEFRELAPVGDEPKAKEAFRKAIALDGKFGNVVADLVVLFTSRGGFRKQRVGQGRIAPSKRQAVPETPVVPPAVVPPIAPAAADEEPLTPEEQEAFEESEATLDQVFAEAPAEAEAEVLPATAEAPVAEPVAEAAPEDPAPSERSNKRRRSR